MPERHALLGPSGAQRWLACPPSARLEEGLEDRGSIYAEEGTVAHKLAELTLRDMWPEELRKPTQQEWEAVQASSYYCAEMEEAVSGYVSFIAERMAAANYRCGDPRIFVEQEVDLSEYVPESFGTADCVIIADGLMDVIDLKYGQGNPVSAEDNPQMKLYALGCLLHFGWMYDIQEIRMTIYQPRIDNTSVFSLSADALMKWAEEELRPRAVLAWEGVGEFAPGEQTCKWCKARAVCRARAEKNLELARRDFAQPLARLTPEELAEIMRQLPDLLAWAKNVGDYMLDQAVNHSQKFPGYKLVEGRSNRKYTNEHAISLRLKKAGFSAAEIYKPKELLGITAMEKLVGKKHLEELVGGLIEKPAGAPVLVPDTDKRPEINSSESAAADFVEA